MVKNKIAPPFKEAEFDIMFGKGISYSGDVLDLAAKIDVVNKSGAWYAYRGEKIGQGRENAKLYLEGHPVVMEEVAQQVWEHYGIGIDQTTDQAEAGQTGKGSSQSAEAQGNAAEQEA